MIFKSRISDSIQLKQSLLSDETIEKSIEKAAQICVESLKNGGKIFFCGNGGSAADSMHLAAELSGKYYKDRKALNATSLSSDPVILTAISNDYGFEYCFSRQLEGKFQKGDILISLTTSGQSKNIIQAVKTANSRGGTTLSFTGAKVSELDTLSDIIVKIPSTDTPRIQECQLLLGHILCEMIENEFIED